MLQLNPITGKLSDPDLELVFADRPYTYSITLKTPSQAFTSQELSERDTLPGANSTTVVTGVFSAPDDDLEPQAPEAPVTVRLRQVYQYFGDRLVETLSLKNLSAEAVELDDLRLGFSAGLEERPGWRLCAIPFRVQLDGSRHDYSTEALLAGIYDNATFSLHDHPEPPLTERERLRSEAWAWFNGDRGLLVIKYNNHAIEHSVAGIIDDLTGPLPDDLPEDDYDLDGSPQRQLPALPASPTGHVLHFGGAGFCLYHEPTGAQFLAPGQEFTFGVTHYLPFTGGLTQAFRLYREFLEARGHTHPHHYDPPVNWNELYDIGWFHSNPELLQQNYTRTALLKEAALARDCGCDVLYLDPGWEVIEGTTLWDEARLGTPASLVETLRKEYNLGLAFRTILRTYRDYWPHELLVQHAPGEPPQPVPFGDQQMWEPCLCNPTFWQEKLQRILKITQAGVRFLMVDEMDWRGPCWNPEHGHAVPSTPLEHAQAVLRLANEVRKHTPGLSVEVHDPIWPWVTSRYLPTYWGQGQPKTGFFDENWGFEYMWNCIDDLKTGKALALYYYNLGCSVPLYLHITMAADNDACLFFWWAASTVRHLGIGGKHSHPSIEPPERLPAYDPEQRYQAYQAHMRQYQALKPYFVRGVFTGLAEHLHLHTLPEEEGGVVNVFNLSEQAQEFEFSIPLETLNLYEKVAVQGAQARWGTERVTLKLSLPPMSPGLVVIGDCAR